MKQRVNLAEAFRVFTPPDRNHPDPLERLLAELDRLDVVDLQIVSLRARSLAKRRLGRETGSCENERTC